MTLTKFLQVLPKRGWYVEEGGAIRRKSQGRLYCPVTAAALRLRKGYFLMYAYPDAADQIGLPRPKSRQIVSAADNDRPSNQALRRRLLKTLKIA